MDELIVTWSKTARVQRETFEYWNKRNKSNTYSKKLNLIIYKKIDLLIVNPLSGEKIFNRLERILYFDNYALVYIFENNEIFIAAFWDTRQNPEKLQNILGQ